MAGNSTTARPYAKAVFELAKAEGAYAAWSKQLNILTEIVQQETVHQLLNHPRVTTAETTDVVIAIAGKAINDGGKNLVRLLSENRRLAVLPEIAIAFQELRNEAEKTVDVELRAAVDVSKAQKEKITAALKKRLGREIVLHCVLDESLIGGATIRAGDLIIDSSVRGKLERLASNLTN
ncbi:MAG: F0F1 ATP synthase subunit delta [Gammaproteobacteria bacterium]|nr:F0F1 ATP synthase subunit delta [Gammaproteobacteria bacterium]